MSAEPQRIPRSRRTAWAAGIIERTAADRRVPDALAAAAAVLSGALLLNWLSRLTFWQDEWEILLHRRGWSADTFLDPAVEHLVAIPILIYKILLSTIGMESPVPFQVVAVASFLISVGLLFVYVRSRLGGWLALAAVLPILFLGPAWDNLLFPYQVTWFGSVACGIAAFLCLDRRTRRADLAATALLIGALLFSDAGIPFVAGATVEIALSPQRRRRWFVPGIPTAMWAIWYLGWGRTAETFISFRNAAELPNYVLDGLSSSLSVYLGLTQSSGSPAASALDWGRPLLVLVIVLVAWRLVRLRRPPDRLLATAAVLLGFWSLTALNASFFGLPTVGRYQYFGVVALALVAAELLRGARIDRWITMAVVAVALASALANGTRLRDAAAGLSEVAQKTRGGLAALELARDQVDPALELTRENSGVEYIGLMDAGSYLSAVDDYGSPAYSADELATAPAPGRFSADMVSGVALDVGLAPATIGDARRCLGVDAASSPTAEVPAGGLVIRARGSGVQASLRRYAEDSFPFSLGALPAGRASLLRIPEDRSSVPWALQLSGSGQATVCPAEATSR